MTQQYVNAWHLVRKLKRQGLISLGTQITNNLNHQQNNCPSPFKVQYTPPKIVSSQLNAQLINLRQVCLDQSSSKTLSYGLQVKLEPASYSDEKYALYRRYQSQIHQDPDSSSTGFKNFLVQSPLVPEPIPYADSSNVPRHLPRDYGSYHQLYRLDDELIAVGVIDILPFCVSSVYFFYDAKWEKYSLGKLSAMREASLIQEMHAAGAQTMDSLYMGFYIHSCPKMRYKGEYSPSYLADPEEFTWYPLNSCISKLEQYRYATFRYPEHSLEGSGDPGEGPATAIPNQSLSDVKVVNSIEEGVVYVIPVIASDHWKNGLLRNEFTSCIRALGVDLAKEITFYA
ncbi:hypothetical protein SERLA73DRAFT_48986 [Serpula lacrymans var. lacrymans S7.3]|uniref:N-end rule aminoacyl transferase C-terminal domain-containing protein n=1 Tax=Serpula lacrymans var. lacrymans (strain S7.3) TaxID=936435 RepID=F8PNU2_SERL3|nr:hypothetical protein SERLA73DRAFT_48986 [Serpula lacrymans var. lacrymans S7.3]